MTSKLPRRTILATAGASAAIGGGALIHNERRSGSAAANEGTDNTTNSTGNDTDAETETEPENPDEDEHPNVVRLVHISPDVPKVDLYANGDLVIEEVPPTGQSDYKWYAENTTFTLTLTPHGAGKDRAILTTEVTLTTGPHTLVLVGEDCRAGPPLTITVNDDNYTTPNEGLTRLNFTHGVTDVDTIGVWAGNGESIISGLSLGETATVDIPTETKRIAIYDDASATRLAAFELNSEQHEFKEQGFYSAYAIGYKNPENAPATAPDDYSFVLGVTNETPPDPEMYEN